jgi:hypothetical protein
MTSRIGKLTCLLLPCLLVLCPALPARAVHNAGDAADPVATGAGGGAAEGLRPVLAASAFLLGAAAVVLEIESDRAYERYLDTADPRRMDTYYDTAERKGDLSTAALVGAELSAVALVVTYLLQKPPAEPAPGSVIIGLAAVPGGVGVRFRW